MFSKHKEQKELKSKMINQKTVCECGYPLALVCRTFSESFTRKKQILVEHEIECPKCYKKNMIIG
jgi:hypothetical protein